MPNYTYEKVAMVDAEFVDYWFKQGNDEKAMEIYRTLTTRAPGEVMYATSGNTLLRILLKHGKKYEAWALFFEDISSYDSETINMMVNECFEMGKFKEAMDTFKLGDSFAPCYRNIIDRFCERGMMCEAEDLFDKMWSHEGLVLSYEVATMIRGCSSTLK
ncbi:Pentatricopeptide repeat-containing protein [Cardamine amara subsp. amara]|uniref:Pentatricopeptide repeat-containing protein n=1 Tax=Cardamine amara subsp. amara TaxID=228776 RepID=A0ABD1C702_CARAN